MADANRCSPDGWVVGARNSLPSEPSEFQWPGRKALVGCNHLVCLDCKAEVKSKVGFRLELDWHHREQVPKRAIQMQTTDDWSRIDGIESRSDYRLYTCRCFHHSLFEIALTFDPTSRDLNDQPSRNLPWTCAGHPPLDLPVKLANRTVVDVPALTAAILDAAKDPAQAEVVLGLYFRTQNGALDEVVTDALKAAAAGPTPLPPTLWALFERDTRLAPLSRLLEDLMEYQLGLGDANPTRRAQIADVLARSVWQQPGGSRETGTRDILRDEALGGHATSLQLRMFEETDSEWFVAQLDELMARNPDQRGEILARVAHAMLNREPDHDAVLKKIAALARETGVDGATLEAQAKDALSSGAIRSKEILAAIRG
jgi:hypothetical protein